MKIIIPKINKEPYHSLTKSDVKLIFKIAPNDWTSEIKVVILSAEPFKNSHFDRPVIYSGYSSRLNILSRGLTKDDIAKEVFRELGLRGRLAQTSYCNHIPKSELAKLDNCIKPYLKEFLKQLKHNQSVQTNTVSP